MRLICFKTLPTILKVTSCSNKGHFLFTGPSVHRVHGVHVLTLFLLNEMTFFTTLDLSIYEITWSTISLGLRLLK